MTLNNKIDMRKDLKTSFQMSFPILKHISIILIILTFFNCTDNTWEQQGSHGVDNWPKVLTNGTEKYVFNYRDTTAIHYFDNENAEKIWFCKFRNPKKEVLKMRYVLKTQKHMVNGWIYSDELFDHTEWPMKISKNNESYVFDYDKNTVVHYFDDSNAEKLYYKRFTDPFKEVFEPQNIRLRIDRYIVDGWQQSYANTNCDTILSITKGKESYYFDYKNKTVIHNIDDANAEELRFSKIVNPQRDVLERRNLVYARKIRINGWQLDGSYGEHRYPTSMKRGNDVYEFDYTDGFTAYHFVNGRRTEAIGFPRYSSPMDCINNRLLANIKEYKYNPQGVLSYVRYYSRGKGDLYFDVHIENGYEDYTCTGGIYKKGTGYVDDKIVDIDYDPFYSFFYSIYHINEIDQRTGTPKNVANLSGNELKRYLLKNYLGWKFPDDN